MNLPELINKLLLIERQLIEEGIEVNTVKVKILPTFQLIDELPITRDITNIELEHNNVLLS